MERCDWVNYKTLVECIFKEQLETAGFEYYLNVYRIGDKKIGTVISENSDGEVIVMLNNNHLREWDGIFTNLEYVKEMIIGQQYIFNIIDINKYAEVYVDFFPSMDCERKTNKEFIEGYRFEKCGFCVSIKDKIVFEDYNLNSMRIEYVLRESILDLLKFFDEKKIEFNQIEIYGDGYWGKY